RLIAALRDDNRRREDIRAALREIGDVDRMVGRLGVQRTTPRELRALADSLLRLPPLRDALRGLHAAPADALADHLEGLDEPANLLHEALAADAPLAMREGGIFRDGYHEELDRLRAISRDGASWLSEYQARESERTGIPSLKVGFNRVFGYYIEITNAHRQRVPDDYVRKQTLKNAERYITDELKRYESEVLSAESRANELEYDMFVSLRDRLMPYIPRLQQAAGALAAVDVLAGWAELSLRRGFCRPEFVETPLLEIEAGRHPVLDATLEKNFVPNDAQLAAPGATGQESPDRAVSVAETAEPSDPPPRETSAPLPSLALITGPNMAGKSTYIRQVALLTLLAHCGCWVPARRMRLGLVDRIFTRVGASDELARGQSTFMVEMLETANILHNASPRSLVILDEIGRGTSTFDGLSLAWAITEYLARRVRCRTLFATHYHELTELGDSDHGLEEVANLNVAVREYEDQIVFLHRIVPGAADRSYGLHVAKLAGVPREVLDRANTVLNELEKTFDRESRRPVLAAMQRRRKRQLRLFEEPEELIVRALREMNVDEVDPAQAAERLRKWRAMLSES
ncbi:MAG: DNA mismatch repair protein MutS, partial [Planctomycetota bacterium]